MIKPSAKLKFKTKSKADAESQSPAAASAGAKSQARVQSKTPSAPAGTPPESERLAAHQKTRRRHFASVLVVFLLLAILGLLTYAYAQDAARNPGEAATDSTPSASVRAAIVDETGAEQISARMREYMANLEQDFADCGYTVTRFTLPASTSRTLYVDLAARSTDETLPYLKVTIDRGSAVSVEDAVRMLDYLAEHDLHPAYVDVRVEGKAYYK